MPVHQAEAGSYPVRQHEVRLVPVVARMRRVGDGRSAPADSGFADDLTALELLAGQIDVDSRRKSIPHVALDALSVEIDVCAEQVAAEQVVNYQRGDVALTTTRVFGRPSIILIRGVQTPGFADCLF